MADDPTPAKSKERSPSFPFIPLEAAVLRMASFDAKFGRHGAPANKVGLAWDMKETSSQADQTLAALRSFGLVVYKGNGPGREVTLSEEGRNYLRAQQDSVKEQILKVCALRPKIMRQFWAMWGPDRPIDPVALDTLILQHNFSENGARSFLRVYDATVSFAKLSTGDKPSVTDPDGEEEPPPPAGNKGGSPAHGNPPPAPGAEAKVKIMPGERELTTGLLSKDANFRLIVSGPVGVKEIERLIAKLNLDKEILAEPDEPDEFDKVLGS